MSRGSTVICSHSWESTPSIYYVKIALNTFCDIQHIHTGITHTHTQSHKLHASQHQLAYMSMCSEAIDIVCGPAGSFIDWLCARMCVCVYISGLQYQPSACQHALVLQCVPHAWLGQTSAQGGKVGVCECVHGEMEIEVNTHMNWIKIHIYGTVKVCFSISLLFGALLVVIMATAILSGEHNPRWEV